jgi:hypothetical protein
MAAFFAIVCLIATLSCALFHRMTPRERWSMKIMKGGLATAVFWGMIYCSGWFIHIPATNVFLGTLGAALTLGTFWGLLFAFFLVAGASLTELSLRIKAKMQMSKIDHPSQMKRSEPHKPTKAR